MKTLADLQSLAASYRVVHGVHQGKPYVEFHQGKKIVATLLLATPNTILSWDGKSDIVHTKGLKRHSTSWSQKPHDWSRAVELAVIRHAAYNIMAFSHDATRDFEGNR